MNPNWGAGIFAIFWMISSFITTRVYNVGGEYSYWLFYALSIMGLSSTAIFYYWQQKFRDRRDKAAQKAQQAVTGGGGAGAAAAGEAVETSEVDLLVRDAEARLAASRQGAKISGLPVIFLVGDPGSVKTTTMVHSGMEPELLAGQIYQDNVIASTRAANLWFARKAVFVEAGGRLLGDTKGWQRLLKKLAPGKLKSVFGKGAQAPRAAILCFDMERFLQAGASDAVAMAARAANARLGEISQQFGISFPVYVLFTKTDRVPFFAEFVRNLSNDEATQVFGCTLPMRSQAATGVYAEEETKRLNQYFNELFYSLCDKRIVYLPRENDPEKLPPAYEFPREFRKLRTGLVQFLVDVGRPSQLRASPFLRGFYFTGVRPIVVNDMAPTPVLQQAPQQTYGGDFGATSIFKPGMLPMQQPPQMAMGMAAPQPTGRRVPQWVFLSHFFNDIVLEDKAAMGASGASIKASFLQRMLLGLAGFLALFWSLMMVVSFFNNRSLENRVIDAARNIPTTTVSGGSLPRVADLEQLDTLRQSVEQLSKWKREGAPWSYRWGLYVGNDLYPEARKVYFECFRRLLFNDTQSRLLTTMRGMQVPARPTDDYLYSYDTLKPYLITTSHHDRSTREYLSPLLLARWAERRSVDELRTLAAKQFDFYSEELRLDNPYSSSREEESVDRARRHLASFGGYERIYNNIIAEANKKFPAVNYNRQFPGSVNVVFNDEEVQGAFTKDGWAFFQQALKQLDKYYGGEEWVLEPKKYPSPAVDRAAIEQQLRTRFRDDFIGRWRKYMQQGRVQRYANLDDASKKLSAQVGAQSPLMQMFWLCSRNTDVQPADDEYAARVRTAFQPVQFISPPGQTDRYSGQGVQGYMDALTSLQGSVAAAAALPKLDDNAANATRMVANTAHGTVLKLARESFKIDPQAQMEKRSEQLLHDPITYAEALLRTGITPGELNTGGANLCKEFLAVTNKFPFSPRAEPEVTLQELTALLKPPGGRIYTFYEQFLKTLLVRQGDAYVPTEQGAKQLNPDFIRWFNQAIRFGETIWANNAQSPMLTYVLYPAPSDNFQVSSLIIDGQAMNMTPGTRTRFTWAAAPNGMVKLDGRAAGGAVSTFQMFPAPGRPNQTPMWAVFRFFADAESYQERPGPSHYFQWVVRSGVGGAPQMVEGKPVAYAFFLDVGNAPPVFSRVYLERFRCVSRVALR